MSDWLPRSLPEWLGAYGALVSTMLGIHAIRKERSRVRVRIQQVTNNFGEPDVVVTVVYAGGPPLPIKKIGFRMLGMETKQGKRFRYNVFTLDKHRDNVLRPDNREVGVQVYSDKDVLLSRLWYVAVEAAGGQEFRKLYRFWPPFIAARRRAQLKKDETAQ